MLREKHIRLVILTKEYGKITVWYYRQLTGVDIGDIARFVVRRENSINIVKSINTKYYLLHKRWSYTTLFSFLSVIKILKHCVVNDDIASQIFDDYAFIMQQSHIHISEDFCHLLQMRIFKYLGTLNPDFFSETAILRYMYSHINKTPLDRIMQTRTLIDSERTIIMKSNLFSLSTFM